MTAQTVADIDRERLDHRNEVKYKLKAEPGLTKEVIEMISSDKNEPEWMLEFRLKALEVFNQMPMPDWGPSLAGLDLNQITFFMTPEAMKNARSWDDVPADIKRTFDRLGIPEAERKALAGAGAQYECLSGDSDIWTNPRGHVKIKDIKPGAFVYSLDEKTNEIKKARVLGVKCSGEKTVFEVQIGTRKIKASDNHPFLILEHVKWPGKRRGRYHKVWKSLRELKKGDLIAIAVKIPDSGESYQFIQPVIDTHARSTNQFGVEHEFRINYNKVSLPLISDIDIMWFSGVFLGDGYITKVKGRKKARVNIAIPETQKDLRGELKNVISRLFGKDLISEYKHYISINSSIIAHFLEANGFSGNAHTKSIPAWLFSVPQEQKLAFLGGYLDTDGHVRKNEGDVSFTSVNKNILEDVRKLADYCNLRTSNTHKFESKHPFDKARKIIAYRLQLTGDITKLGSRYSFKKNRLDLRKYHHKYKTAKGTVFRKHCSDYLGFVKINSIKEIGKEAVYDIEVEGFHNFVANGIIVHNSDVVYHNLKKEWEDLGVVFLDTDEALQQYPELIKKYFMTTCVPVKLHKFSALHAAVWSGGTFIYVPENVKVGLPLQAYFRMNAEKMGQFEHTLIIAEKNSQVSYIEGCSAPIYVSSSLHAGCVEIHVKENARVRYSSVENWSKNTYNLNTKRAVADRHGIIEWINGNTGSRCTMLYPCSVLKGEYAKSDYIGIAFAGKGQHQDTGHKVYHLAPHTSSTVTAKSISKDGGISSYRGLLRVNKGSIGSKSRVRCDALIVDEKSISNTFPYMKINEKKVDIAHEATVGRISADQLFYLMSRGLTEEQASQMIVSGFIEPVIKELPLEYAVELNRLIQLEMEGSVG